VAKKEQLPVPNAPAPIEVKVTVAPSMPKQPLKHFEFCFSVKFVTRMFLGEIQFFEKYSNRGKSSAQPKLYLIMAFKAVMSVL
jgi:hypothetical protein